MAKMKNPLRRWSRVATFLYFLYCFKAVYDIYVYSGNDTVLGSPASSGGWMAPVVPFGFLGTAAFLWFYKRRMRYAWHALMASAIAIPSVYWFCSYANIYYQDPGLNEVDFAVWLYLLWHFYGLKRPYEDYLARVGLPSLC
ncbi:hypothetical protein STSP2_00917 [Anaerohalosphaera lusitana]|uniref:Uncharacterized protein n=1 Tax=Anaerohalosphaera lusitana TaxID=1936003 RepID=A0A1U9NJ60_9BACT|nr:hypothetical protein [Anaerohalosphaera lusitana]AQT67768.1 hypothetical protein STSP2_00917 [Anaerohalosphaera lusitana]